MEVRGPSLQPLCVWLSLNICLSCLAWESLWLVLHLPGAQALSQSVPQPETVADLKAVMEQPGPEVLEALAPLSAQLLGDGVG